MVLRAKGRVVIKSDFDLVRQLNGYLAFCEENPLQNVAKYDEATGRVEHLTSPRVGSATGFATYLGRTQKELLALRDKYPEAFGQCIEMLRGHMRSRATDKKFVEMVASRPLLDLNLNRR